MWNKLFKKRQSKQSDKSQAVVSEVRKVKQRPTSTTKCFSFRNAGTKINGNDQSINLFHSTDFLLRDSFNNKYRAQFIMIIIYKG